MLNIQEHQTLGELGVEVFWSGYAQFDSDWKYNSTEQMYSVLYYIKKGKGYLSCEGKTIPLEEGNCYFIPAGTRFSYWCDEGEEIEKVFFHFSLISATHFDLFNQIHEAYSVPLLEIDAEGIFDSYGKDRYWNMMNVKVILYRTISYFVEKTGLNQKPVRIYSDTVEKIMHYIQQNLSVQLKTEKIAKKLFISESKIRKLFKVETGMTVGDYIDELIFLNARRMLMKKGISLWDISTKLGFCDQFYFSRRFKEKFGITPSQYRKEAMLKQNCCID